MTQAIEALEDYRQMEKSPGLIKRISVLLYGLLAYNIGVAGLLWIILAMGGLAPVGFSPLKTGSVASALLVNFGLIMLFGLQHSIMARAGFKNMLKEYLPEAAERSTFVLMSGICMAMAIYFWQPVPGNVWMAENTALQVMLWVLFTVGWSYLFIATFVTNHFELMGLRQVYLYFIDKPYSKLPFTQKYMYRYSRHPMMLGVMVGMWSVPAMSFSHFVMASLLTLYIVIGVMLEERDLIRQFGKTYLDYKRQIATLLPRVF